MTIKIYPSQMPGEAIEVHEFSGLISDWFHANGLEFESKEDQPITLTVDGATVHPDKWASFSVDADDEVEIRIIPHGWTALIYAVIIAFTVAAVMAARRAPATSNTPQGKNIDSSTAEANRAMLGSVVPELAGQFRRFPDYLNPPRRYFANDREQILEVLCCIGPGDYQINDENVKVGDTPFSAIGEDTTYTIYPPDSDLSSDPSHINWYNVDEVGGTSSGTAGLELSSVISANTNPIVGSYLFSGNEISLSPDQGKMPDGWGAGTIFTVRFPRSYVVTQVSDDPTFGTINVFSGNFSNIMPLSLGEGLFYGNRGCLLHSFSIDSLGNGSIRLYETDGGGGSIPISGEPTGTRSITFYKSNRTYRVTSNTPNLFTVQARDNNVDVTWSGWFPITTNSPVWSVTSSTIFGEWSNWFRACPNTEKTETLEVDFFFPEGLAYVNDNGSLSSVTVLTQVEWRDAEGVVAGGNADYSYNRATVDQIGFTERISIPSMLPEIRVRRRGSTNPEQRVRNKVQWYGCRSILPTVTSYPRWTVMSARLRTGGKLAAQSENKINVVATRVLPELVDGAWTDPVPTRDVSAFVRYICSTIGYTEQNIDIDELQRLQNIWSARGETADYVFDQTTVKEALNVVLGAGMSEFTVSDGQIKPVRDDVRTQKEYSYSPLNMMGPLRRRFRSPKHDDPDGVEVEFINAQTWTSETIDCLLPDDLGLKKERIKLNGVTSKTRAWRIGMRYRRSLKYRSWEYNFSTELDGLNSEYLSYDFLFDDIPGYGKAALMYSITEYGDKALIRCGDPLEWDLSKNYVVAYRKTDGSLVGPFNAEKGTDEFSVIANVPKPWPAINLRQEPPHVFIGTTERWTFPVLVTEVVPRGTASVDIKAMNYDVRVYADDNSNPD